MMDPPSPPEPPELHLPPKLEAMDQRSEDSDEFALETRLVVLNFLGLVPNPSAPISLASSGSSERNVLSRQSTANCVTPQSADTEPPWQLTLTSLPESDISEKVQFQSDSQDKARGDMIRKKSQPSRSGGKRSSWSKTGSLSRDSEPNFTGLMSDAVPYDEEESYKESIDEVDGKESDMVPHSRSLALPQRQFSNTSNGSDMSSSVASENSSFLASGLSTWSSQSTYIDIQRVPDVEALIQAGTLPPSTLALRDELNREMKQLMEQAKKLTPSVVRRASTPTIRPDSLPISTELGLDSDGVGLESDGPCRTTIRLVGQIGQSEDHGTDTLGLEADGFEDHGTDSPDGGRLAAMTMPRDPSPLSGYMSSPPRPLTPESEVAEALRAIGDQVDAKYGQQLQMVMSTYSMSGGLGTYESLSSMLRVILNDGMDRWNQVALVMSACKRITDAALTRGEHCVGLITDYCQRLLMDFDLSAFIVGTGGWQAVVDVMPAPESPTAVAPQFLRQPPSPALVDTLDPINRSGSFTSGASEASTMVPRPAQDEVDAPGLEQVFNTSPSQEIGSDEQRPIQEVRDPSLMSICSEDTGIGLDTPDAARPPPGMEDKDQSGNAAAAAAAEPSHTDSNPPEETSTAENQVLQGGMQDSAIDMGPVDGNQNIDMDKTATICPESTQNTAALDQSTVSQTSTAAKDQCLESSQNTAALDQCTVSQTSTAAQDKCTVSQTSSILRQISEAPLQEPPSSTTLTRAITWTGTAICVGLVGYGIYKKIQ